MFFALSLLILYFLAVHQLIMQKVKSSIKHHTINPEWNEELTLSITNMMLPVKIVSSSPSASTHTTFSNCLLPLGIK
jgi:hypothetical protein